MEYLLAFQVLCGCFAAYVTARQGRNWLAWFAVGMLLPVVGVVLALSAAKEHLGRKATARRILWGKTDKLAEGAPRRPRRCRGSYIPDCQGCPYFRRNPLFEPGDDGPRKGYCRYYRQALVENDGSAAGDVPVDEESLAHTDD